MQNCSVYTGGCNVNSQRLTLMCEYITDFENALNQQKSVLTDVLITSQREDHTDLAFVTQLNVLNGFELVGQTKQPGLWKREIASIFSYLTKRIKINVDSENNQLVNR